MSWSSTHQGSHLHATLQQIEKIANEDVEMQPPLSEYSTYLVVDTNILLHNFDVLAQFVKDVERLSLPMIIMIPGAVISELDGQKKRDGLAWFARRASAWLLAKVKERKSVKGQAHEETCKKSRNWKIEHPGDITDPERRNDALIIDCCMYFRQLRPTWLCSADNNLCFESVSQDISTISPTFRWSSQDIARVTYPQCGPDELGQFESFQSSYKDPGSTSAAVHDDEDSMDIDDIGVSEKLLPSHALDLLHVQVVDHFLRLLIELVRRVQAEDGLGTSQHVSIHAPKHYSDSEISHWDALDCLEYLNGRKPVPHTSPRADLFLRKPYAKGARRGQDWSRKDWEVALGSLAKTGDIWKDMSIRESLGVLRTHMDNIFAQKLRPTGI